MGRIKKIDEKFEIPDEIKSLYRHWEFHTKKEPNFAKQNLALDYDKRFKTKIFRNTDLEKEIRWFINERINIWKNKVQNKNKPYTKDKILQKYRFCNIFREFDKQTIEFHKILNPIRNYFSLWLLNMFYFRMVANIETVKTLGLLSFDKTENQIFYEEFVKLRKPKFGVPYVFPVSTILRSKFNTREKFISFYLPEIIEKVSLEILKFQNVSVLFALDKILSIFKFNLKFLWAEVLIDIHYQFPELINLYDDFYIGPGALPTLKRINKNISPELLCKNLVQLNFKTNVFYDKKELILSVENWEGVCCEFRKYSNLKNGFGRKRKL